MRETAMDMGEAGEGPPRAKQGPRPARRRRAAGVLGPWLWIVAASLAAVAASYILFVEPPPPRRIVIAAGGREGTYHRYATAYAAELRKNGVEIEVRETAGSVENLKLLGDDESGVSLAIVQGGVADPSQIEAFQSLGSLYREPLWVFHRADRRVSRLRDLAGMRVGVGAEGSGTRAVATRLLAAEEAGSPGGPAVELVGLDAAETTAELEAGRLDAAFFVAAVEAEYIGRLLRNEQIRLLGFHRQEAYRRRFRFLSPVTLPAGLIDLAHDVPANDVELLAPTAMLAAKPDFHPALVPLLLAAVTRIHGGGGLLSEPREFPSEAFCDFEINDDASRYYRSGQPVLQRLLPFWLASLADRAKLMIIPLVMLMTPLLRAAPPLIRWRTRRKIYRWYDVLRKIDQKLAVGLSGADLDRQIARLDEIEHKVMWVDVPLSYMEEFYHLRLHLGMLQQRLQALKAAEAPAP